MANRKLLLINKFYHDIGPAGGVGRYLVQEEEDLLKAGWDVIPFAMADEHARPSDWSRYFVKARDYSKPRFGMDAAQDALSLIWNREAARNLDALIRETRPDVAHLHNIYHHLSPSILPVLKKHGIPVVMTLHDLRLLCPAIHMLRHGEICEDCRGGQLHNAVRGRCVKESRAASALAAVETFLHRARGMYPSAVNVFLCPSRFIRNKYIEWGFPADQMRHLPNFVDLDIWHPDRIKPSTRQDAYLYFGRISKEKGLRTLLDAQALWEKDSNEKPLQLLIAGEGPCTENVRARIAQLNLKTVSMLESLSIPELQKTMGRCRFTVLPSECFENGPMATLESLAAGIPVVGTNIGGIPESILDEVTGVIVPARNSSELLKGLVRASSIESEAGAAARKWAEKNASRQDHMAQLEALFIKLIEG